MSPTRNKILARRILVTLFEADRKWLEENGVGYSEFVRSIVHAHVTTLRSLNQLNR